jgi:hypothetical protein
VGFAPEQRCKAFLSGPVQVLHDLAQRRPLIISATGDGAPAVVAPTGISTMLGIRRMSISYTLSFSPIAGVIEQDGVMNCSDTSSCDISKCCPRTVRRR